MYRVGVIGLGKMGLPIARNLIERGFEVIGYRRHSSPELVVAGGVLGSSPADVAAQADILLSILPDGLAVDEVVGDSSRGTLSTLRPGTVHVEMSTIDVERKRVIRDRVRVHGGDLIDCPISGSPGMVAPRLATTFVSGEQASIDRVSSVLDAISGRWVYAGAFGAGTHLKYITNLLVAVHTVATAEAMVLARRSGLDLDLVQRAVDDSIGASAIWKQRGPMMQQRTWPVPAPGPIDTLYAILQQIETHADGVDMDTPMFSSAKTVFDKAVADGWGQRDIAAVHDQFDPDIGIEPREG